MIIESIVLFGILYYGYQELKKTDNTDKLMHFRSHNEIPDSALSKRMNELFEDVENTPVADKKKPPSKSSFRAKTQQDLKIVASSLALTSLAEITPSLAFLSPLAIPLILYSSRQIHFSTFNMLKRRKVNVNTLMTITLTTLLLRGQFFIASLISMVIRLAFYYTERIAYNSKQQLTNAFDQHPEHVWVWVDGVEILAAFDSLQIGDIVIVQAGEVVPADGIIIEGTATIDQHILTGESQPIEKEFGDEVFSSTFLLSGKIKFKVEKTGTDTTVAKIQTILKDTIEFKATTQLRAETFSEQLVKPVFIASGLALPLIGVHGTLAVMSTHPKNKTMILSPLIIMNHLTFASRQGILVKDGRSLELLNKVDTLVFDKTGTLTEEQPHVGTIYCCNGANIEDILRYAAIAEHKQAHPLAKAIMHAAKAYNLDIPRLIGSEYRVGFGLIVELEGQRIHVGSERFMCQEDIIVPTVIQRQQKQAQIEGYTLVMVAVNGILIGAIELLPTLRPGIKEIITTLKRQYNIKNTYIISGDNEIPTGKLAAELGVDRYFAQVLPQDKAEYIKQLQTQGCCVCYIGDGINDSIALKTAQVSISLRGASTVATDTAQIILMDSGLEHLPALFKLAKDFNSKMNTTFVILLIPSVLGLTGAFLFGFGIAQTVALNMTGLGIGLANVMRPINIHNNSLMPSKSVRKASILRSVKYRRREMFLRPLLQYKPIKQLGKR